MKKILKKIKTKYKRLTKLDKWFLISLLVMILALFLPWASSTPDTNIFTSTASDFKSVVINNDDAVKQSTENIIYSVFGRIDLYLPSLLENSLRKIGVYSPDEAVSGLADDMMTAKTILALIMAPFLLLLIFFFFKNPKKTLKIFLVIFILLLLVSGTSVFVLYKISTGLQKFCETSFVVPVVNELDRVRIKIVDTAYAIPNTLKEGAKIIPNWPVKIRDAIKKGIDVAFSPLTMLVDAIPGLSIYCANFKKVFQYLGTGLYLFLLAALSGIVSSIFILRKKR